MQLNAAIIILAAMFFQVDVKTSKTPDKMRLQLQEALLRVDRHFNVPISAELLAPTPRDVIVVFSEGKTVEQELDDIKSQCPFYTWSKVNGVYLFQHRLIKDASSNPFNQRLTSYQIPPNLGLFRLTFPTAVISASKHEVIKGYALSGSAEGATSISLKKEVVSNDTARDILLRVGGQVDQFFSLLILSNQDVANAKPTEDSFLGWEIVGGQAVSSYQLHYSLK